jgi:hypothetical protein
MDQTIRDNLSGRVGRRSVGVSVGGDGAGLDGRRGHVERIADYGMDDDRRR